MVCILSEDLAEQYNLVLTRLDAAWVLVPVLRAVCELQKNFARSWNLVQPLGESNETTS